MSQAGDRSSGAGRADIERMIERGLQLYGVGEVDGALAVWEQALALDPEDVRAAAYVDYVRENYEMLASTSRITEDDVPFGLGAVPGDPADDYEIEVTAAPGSFGRAAAAPVAPVEHYIESIDEGWFLDEEPASFPFDEPPPPPHAPDVDAGARPSRQLPLPANPSELTLEIEAEEPDPDEQAAAELPGFDAPPASSSDEPAGDDDDQTGDFGARRGWAHDQLPAPDFTDQKSALPTQEIAAPRGFVRSRLAPVVSAAESAAGVAAAGTPAAEAADDDDDDRLRTRPGRITGAGPLEPTGEVPRGVAPEVLSSLRGEFGGGTGTGHGGRAIGPDERTRELPHVRVTFNPDTQDLPTPPDLDLDGVDLAPEVDERTTERNSARFDTSSEPTTERGPEGGRMTTPAPIDEPPGDPSGRHPPLVIVEDPILAPPAPSPSDDPDSSSEYDLNPGTAKVRRVVSASVPSVPAGAVSIDEVTLALETSLDDGAPADEAPSERTRRRVGSLLDRAVEASTSGDHPTAIVALDLALREEPDSAIAQKLVHRHQPAILDVYQRYLGDLSARPTLAMPMHELADQKLDIRAAFLLSRIDGALSFEEILDVSGMARGEAFRHLSMLLLRGILEVR